MSKELGGRISELLKKTNVQQKELADRVGVSEGVMSRYISGDRDPKPEMLANIATALKTTSDYLLGIEENDYSYSKVKRMIARNAQNMTAQEKRDLINALFGEG